jgi:hypothetical protein
LTAAVLSAQADAQAQASFCERLADQTGMTAERAKPGEPALWSTRVMNLAQRFLVGGQTMVTMQMAPGDAGTAGDYARLGDACKPIGKTLACHILGPAEFRMGINGKASHTMVQPGEKAQVEMKGTRITCRNGA